MRISPLSEGFRAFKPNLKQTSFGFDNRCSQPDWFNSIVRLTPSDFEVGQYIANEDLVERVASRVVGPDRFIALTKLPLEMTSDLRVQEFLIDLVQRAYNKALALNQEQLNPNGWEVGMAIAKLNGIGTSDTIGEGLWGYPCPLDKPRPTNKLLHLDGYSPIVGVLYKQKINVRGGYPQFADVREYCQANKLELKNITRQHRGLGSILPTLKSPHYKKVLDEYTVTLTPSRLGINEDEPFIVIFNNSIISALMHGATGPSKIVKDQYASRNLVNTSMMIVDPNARRLCDQQLNIKQVLTTA